MAEVILDVKNLKKHFPVGKGLLRKHTHFVKAVDGVSFKIFENEIVGLVGESGCGKTTVGKCILMLEQPSSGSVVHRGVNLVELHKEKLRHVRQSFSLIFQDPFTSLNPRMKVSDIVCEPLEIHRMGKRREREEMATELLQKVGILPQQIRSYPHQFSGGQKQRIAIARALVTNPELIIADEPVAALDVSIKASIMNLMTDLQKELRYSCLFISHDFRVVKYISDRMIVMYAGKLVESAEKGELFKNPLHPYTRALISSVFVMDPTMRRKRETLLGEAPSPVNFPSGCRFHPRCPYVHEVCSQVEPEIATVKDGHLVACHLNSV